MTDDDWRGEGLIRGRQPSESEKRSRRNSLANYVATTRRNGETFKAPQAAIHKRLMRGIFIDLMSGRAMRDIERGTE